jgi:hypothetical protein
MGNVRARARERERERERERGISRFRVVRMRGTVVEIRGAENASTSPRPRNDKYTTLSLRKCLPNIARNNIRRERSVSWRQNISIQSRLPCSLNKTSRGEILSKPPRFDLSRFESTIISVSRRSMMDSVSCYREEEGYVPPLFPLFFSFFFPFSLFPYRDTYPATRRRAGKKLLAEYKYYHNTIKASARVRYFAGKNVYSRNLIFQEELYF